MKRSVLFISGLLVISLFLLSGSDVIASEKTGFMSMQEVMLKSNAGKKASEAIKKIYDKDRAQIQAKEAELQKLKDELEKQKSILTESAMRDKEASYQKLFRNYQMMVKDINDELQAKDQEFAKKMVPEIMKVVNAIGEKGKYTLIIDISATPLPYYAKENEVTTQVIEELNKTYKP